MLNLTHYRHIHVICTEILHNMPETEFYLVILQTFLYVDMKNYVSES